MKPDSLNRSVCQSAERPYVGLTTYGARIGYSPRSRASSAGGAERLDHAARRHWLQRVSSVRRAILTPTTDRLAANGLKFNRFHTTACVRAGAGGVRRGGITRGQVNDHRDRDVRARQQPVRPATAAPLAQTSA